MTLPLKILFLTPWYPDENVRHHGVFIRDQAAAVSGKHKVAVISSKVDYRRFGLFSWRLQSSVYHDVREYRVVMRRSLPFLNQLLYLLVSLWVSRKVSKKFKPDIIHGNIAYPGAIWSYCLSRLFGLPFIVSDHTSRFTDNFRSPFHHVVTRFALRRAAKVVAVSKWAAKNISAVIDREVEVVPNLIHVSDYAVVSLPGERTHAGFLGGLGTETHRKGLDLLLKAIAPIRKNFVLHIGGAGSYLEYYKELARSLGVMDRCQFHGFIDHVPDFMKELHFFISSSRTEAFGMVIVEAMACGLPVVTTLSGGPADYMSEDVGRMVPVNDIDQLRQSVDWMIDNYQTFDRHLIRANVEDNYSSEAFLRRIDKIYRQISAF